MRSRSNGGVIGAYALPTQNYANGVFFIHDAAIYNTGNNPIWPLGTGFIYSATGGTVSTAADNTNYKTHTFSANGTFSVVTGSAYIDILLVGGGGGTDYSYYNSSLTVYSACGGAGGGAVALVQNLFVDAGTNFTVEVGIGGPSVNGGTGALAGNSGYPSKITSNRGHSVIARGGGKGGFGTATTFLPSVGGSGGGGLSYYTSGGTYLNASGASTGATDAYTLGTSASITYYQNIGGTGQLPSSQNTAQVNAGGGGGAMGAGYNGNYATNPTLASYGGDGFQWNRTGLYYGAGGAGGSATRLAYSGLYGTGLRIGEGNNGANGYGSGASGLVLNVAGGTASGGGHQGGNGTVIFCYRYQ